MYRHKKIQELLLKYFASELAEVAKMHSDDLDNLLLP